MKIRFRAWKKIIIEETVPGPAASGLAQDGGAASAHNHSLGVAEHCRDPDNNQQVINQQGPKSQQPQEIAVNPIPSTCIPCARQNNQQLIPTKDLNTASAHHHSLGVAEHCRDPDNIQQLINQQMT